MAKTAADTLIETIQDWGVEVISAYPAQSLARGAESFEITWDDPLR